MLVLKEEKKLKTSNQFWGFATLNSESTLNSLSLEMIHELNSLLQEWKKNPDCVGVFLQGAGEKAFCAGGDIKRLYQALKDRKENKKDPYPEDFFVNEYSLDYSIHTYPKPFIVYGHGIVMGGGLGLMSGAALRIATETTKIAMPEITIGLFPDVGGSYFLNRTPGKLGLYLGLTGTRLNSNDCLFAGLVDLQIKRDQKERLIDHLLTQDYSRNKEKDVEKLREGLKTLAYSETSDCPLKEHQQKIEELLKDNDLKASYEKITQLEEDEDPWLAAGAKALRRGCPTSAHVIWRQLKLGRALQLKECFEMELNIAANICKFDNFREGVRALLIDKDNKPQWNPARFSEVSEDFVAAHFATTGLNLKEHRS